MRKKNYAPTLFAKRLEDFLTDYAPRTEGISENTIAAYCSTFRILLSFNEQRNNITTDAFDIKHFTSDNVESFLHWIEEDRGCKTVTRNQRLAALHSFCKYLQKKEPKYIFQLQQILAIKNKRHPVKTVVDYLTVEETASIINSVDIHAVRGIRDMVLISLMYDTAARVQELANLTVGDVKLYDKDTSSLYLTGKWSKTRGVPLSNPSFDLLQQYIQSHGLKKMSDSLFVNRKGEKLTRHGISLIVKKYVQKAKLSCPSLASKTITPHTLRHSKAMHMLQGGIDLVKIRDLLGHESISTTEIYAKTHDTDLRLAMTGANDDLQKLASWHANPGIMVRLASYAKKAK